MVVKCPECGNDEFRIIYEVQVQDILYFIDGRPHVDCDNANDHVEGLGILDADRIVCTKCGKEVPKKLFKDLNNIIWSW